MLEIGSLMTNPGKSGVGDILYKLIMGGNYVNKLNQPKEKKKWEPQTMEEALEFEKAKAKIKDGIYKEAEEKIGGVTLEGQPATTDKKKAPLFREKSIKIGPTTYERVPTAKEKEQNLMDKAAEEIQQEIIKGVSGEVGGRVALAKESLRNIKEIKKLLFPDGTAKSFKRKTAFGSNLPGPGRVVGSGNPLQVFGVSIKDSQEVFRKMGAAISGRQLIQTGVAARPEETEKLIAQFAPSAFSNAEAALNGLDELEQFYGTYLKEADPQTRFKDQPFLAPRKKAIKAQGSDDEYQKYLQAIGG